MERQHKGFYFFNLLTYTFIILHFAYSSVGLSGMDVFLQLALLLLFIVNSQLRFFVFYRQRSLYYPMLLLEAGLAVMLYKLVGGLWFVYTAVLLFDLTLKLSLKHLVPTLALVAALSVAVLHTVPSALLPTVYNYGLNALCMGLISLAGFYLKQESSEKEQAQVLYDKLRVSENELQKAYSQLQGYSATVKELAVLRERNRISRELHDSVGHNISTLIIGLEAVKASSKQSSQASFAMLDNLIDYAKNSMESVRRTVRDMKPIELEDDSGLLAIERLLDTFKSFTGIDTQLIVSKKRWQLSSAQSHNLYRIVQEALNNSAKHSKASKIVVSMNYTDTKLQLKLGDNGVGCESLHPSFGLLSVKERTTELGGTIHFSTAKGFEIFIDIPKGGISLD